MAYNFATNSVLGAIASAATTIGSFLCSIIVARMLGPNDSGSVAYLLWVAFFVIPILDFGASAAVSRFVPEQRGMNNIQISEQIAAHLLGKILFCILIGLIVFCVSLYVPILKNYIISISLKTENYFLVWGLIILYSALGVVNIFGFAYLRSKQDFKKLSMVAVISLVVLIPAVVIGCSSFGALGALVGYVAGSIVPLWSIISLFSVKREIPSNINRRLTLYSRYSWGANIASAFVWSRIETFFLEMFWGSGAVGIFVAALAVSNIAIQLPLMLTTAILPRLSEQKGQNEINKMRETCTLGTRLLAAFVFPSCFAISALIPQLLPALYGEAFRGAVPAAIILVFTATITVTSAVPMNFLYAMEKGKAIFFLSIACAICALLSGFSIIPLYGVVGAAVVRSFVQIAYASFVIWYVMHYMKCRFPFIDLAKILISSLISYASIKITIALIPNDYSIFMALPVGGIFYLIGLRLLKALPSTDLVFIVNMSENFPKFVQEPVKFFVRIITTAPRGDG